MVRRTGMVLLALLAACSGEPEETVQEVPEAVPVVSSPLPDEDVRVILAMDRVFQDAVGSGDWESLRTLYDEEAVVMPPGHETVEGVDEIVEYYAEVNPAGGLPGFNTDTDVIQGETTIGYHRGTWTAGSGASARRGKFLWVLRRTDGEWRIIVDMFNTDG